MALTKTQLKEILSAAGVSAENAEVAIGKIMDGHVASVNALREERDELKKDVELFKSDAQKLVGIQRELDELKAKGDPEWQAKYEKEHTDFEAFKTEIEKGKARDEKVRLYRDLLKECNVEPKRIDAVLKVTDFDGVTVKDGKIENIETLKSGIKKEWSGFIVKKESKGADVDNPPETNGGSGLSRAEIYKKDEKGRYLMDAPARQKALAELIESEE
jgi:hypothetical protein